MDIKIGDLFPERENINLGNAQGESDYPYLRTVVTGGAGSIGSAVVRKLLAKAASEVWIIDNDESRIHTLYETFDANEKNRLRYYVTDIRDLTGLHQRLDQINPDMIIHAAALKHVPILERQPRDAYYTNVIGTSNVMNFLQTHPQTGMVFISSDKAANPKNILGKTKLIGELIAGTQINSDKKSELTRHIAIVRFGNVFLSRGSVIETFIRQIERGEPITITHNEMTRYFMDIDDAAALILEVAIRKIPGISIFKMGDPIGIKDLAIRLQEYLNAKNCNLEVIGVKDGEKIHEDLFSIDEKEKLVDLGSILNSERLSALPVNFFDYVPRDDLQAKVMIDDLLVNSKTI